MYYMYYMYYIYYTYIHIYISRLHTGRGTQIAADAPLRCGPLVMMCRRHGS